MARVVPSHVVEFINRSFTGFMTDASGQNMTLESSHATVVGPLIAMVDALPPELLAQVQPSDYMAFLASVAAMRTALENWSFGTHSAWQARLKPLPGFREHPVAIVRRVLAACPDNAPALTTRELAFLRDPELEADLRLDLSHAFSELADREYKSATVLAGSTVETLLYWAVAQKPTADIAAAATAVKKPKLDPSLKLWGLDDFLKVAHHFKIISDQTVKAADAAKDFRNLIHPERAKRHGRKCDQATAMSALAGALHVITDLEAWDKAGRP
jgi:hypothetical protein